MNAEQDQLPARDAAVLRLVNAQPWGDLGPAIAGFEQTLRCLLDATADQRLEARTLLEPLDTWEGGGWADAYEDGLDMTNEDVDALSGEGRRALVAHLTRLLSYDYYAFAKLVRGLTNISCPGTKFEEDAR
jgi:hypothetical protein